MNVELDKVYAGLIKRVGPRSHEDAARIEHGARFGVRILPVYARDIDTSEGLPLNEGTGNIVSSKICAFLL